MNTGAHRYYFVVASLPELRFGEPPPLETREFLEAYGEELQADRPLLEMILLRNDVRNLKELLRGGEAWVEPAVYARRELEEGIEQGEGLPPFMIEYATAFRQQESVAPAPGMPERGYLRHGASAPNPFLRAAFGFEIRLRNVVSGIRARRLGRDVLSDVETEEGDLFLLKMKENRATADFGLQGEAPWIARILQSFERDDPALVEQSMDAVRFDWIEEQTELLDFQTEVILAYLMKLQILERWAAFDAEEAAVYIRRLTREAMENE